MLTPAVALFVSSAFAHHRPGDGDETGDVHVHHVKRGRIELSNGQLETFSPPPRLRRGGATSGAFICGGWASLARVVPALFLC